MRTILVLGLLLSTAAHAENLLAEYSIDRSGITYVNHNEVTVKVYVDDYTVERIAVDEADVPFVMRGASREVMFNAGGSAISVYLSGSGDRNALGAIAPTELKNDKAMAVSFGMDDNRYTWHYEGCRIFRDWGWKATLYLTHAGSYLDDNLWFAEEPNHVVRAADAQEAVLLGWAIGNHSWSHTKDVCTVADINRLEDYVMPAICEVKPEYRMMSVAAPLTNTCFDAVVEAIRPTWPEYGSYFDEAQGREPYDVSFAPQSQELTTAPIRIAVSAFDYSFPVHVNRDFKYEQDGYIRPIIAMDELWKSHQATGRRYWYNIGMHGFRPDNDHTVMLAIFNHLRDTYDSPGLDTVWVVAAEEIYAYLMIRELADYSFVGVTRATDLISESGRDAYPAQLRFRAPRGGALATVYDARGAVAGTYPLPDGSLGRSGTVFAGKFFVAR
jgi:hypothetical protein